MRHGVFKDISSNMEIPGLITGITRYSQGSHKSVGTHHVQL